MKCMRHQAFEQSIYSERDRPKVMKKSASSNKPSKNQYQILVVDDNATFLTTLCQFLDQMGYECDAAANGLEALQKVAASPFPLVLTDLQMPELNGLQLIEQMKRRYPETDIVVMTGYGQTFGPTEAITAGAIDYITKPFPIEELDAKLKRVFRERELMHAFKDAMNAKKREEQQLRSSQQQLKARLKDLSFELTETSTALRVMLRQREQDQRLLTSDLFARMQKEIFPLLQKLRRTSLSESQKNQIDLICMHLEAVFMPGSRQSTLLHSSLTPSESKIANLIKQRKTSKEIAELLNISVGTVQSHREKIRKKLRITNKKKNLYHTLISLP